MRCSKCGNQDHDVGARNCRVCGMSLPLDRGRATARTSSNYADISKWQRFLLQRLDGPPVELRPDRPFVIGRSSDCQLRIQSPKVSRRHAEVCWKGGRPILRDLKSENGTEVNGKQLRVEHPLQHGDEILIGPFTCTFHQVKGRGSIQTEQDLLDSQSDTQEILAPAMLGDLEEMSVYELLETLSYNQKTGTLHLYSPYDVEGTMMLLDGQVIRAEVESFRGEEAVYSLIAWREGKFRFMTSLPNDVKRNVRRSTGDILAEVSASGSSGLSAEDYGA